MFFILRRKECPAYFSKHYLNREKQVILLMVLNGEKGHYVAVKKWSALLRGRK